MPSGSPTPSFGTAINSLRERFGQRLVTSSAELEQHGRDESWHPGHAPDALLYAESQDDVVAAVQICAKHRMPVIPYGAGTSLEGHIAAVQGGLCVDCSRMNRILQINVDDMDVRVEPGVRRLQLNQALSDSGLFFSVDPGADASLGGMAATRASGTNAVRYGTMRDNVLALTVVTPAGGVVRTARRARKSAAGYDLTRLFVGSEGTLGIITELTLKLHGLPEAVSAASCAFPDLAAAVQTVMDTIRSGVPIARIELLDEVQIAAVNAYSGLTLPVAPTLFLEFHGTESSVEEQAEIVSMLAAEHGGKDFRWARRSEERNQLWRARHDAAYAAKALRPDGVMWPTDVCVPISRLAECVLQTREDIQDSALTAPIVGHVGDGNFHVVLVLDPEDNDELERAKAFNRRLIERALAMDGTCSGEHGIGYGKLAFLRAEHGAAVDLMQSIKRALDPDDIMNPGKLLPAD